MAQLHISEAEAARDFHTVLSRVRNGDEVIIDEDRRPVAVIRLLRTSGRPISECIASARASNSMATLDEGMSPYIR
jgi:antitoxin (DNA-binding transcriptional repressor) of toxin-antitoxin stability system